MNSDPYLTLLKSCLTGSLYRESAWQIVAPGNRKKLKRWIIQMLARRSYIVVKCRDYDDSLRAEGRDWPMIGYTMIGKKRLDNIQECVEDIIAKGIPGDLIETGAWRGGATIFMRALLHHHGVKDKIVWVADSFEGLPKPDIARYGEKAGVDLSDRALLKVSLEEVKENFARFDLLDGQVQFIKGWFCDTLPKAPIRELSLLRLDGDLYESTMDALISLYPRVSVGGYVIVDDYYSWPSCKSAVDDFRERNHISEEIKPVDKDGVFWKVGSR